jgi:hypothetical protein
MARGDHLYVDRLGGVYSHHGIDCGDGTVIHYWPDEVPLRSSVQRTTLSEFAEGDPVRTRNYAACDPPETVLRRAVSSLGARGFDPLTSNCEHFAVWCKTGRVESSQVRSVESYLLGQPGGALMTLLFSPVVPVLVLAVFVGNVLGGLAGETQDR